MNAKFYSGASGLILPVPRSLYPEGFQQKSRLEYYSSLFNSIEINSCFYKTPRPDTVAKWHQLVPDEFRFTFKLSKAVTHSKELEFNEDNIECFMHVIDHAKDKKGCLLIQFPPSLTIERLDRLQQLLRTVNFFNNGWILAVEFRNRSWYENEVYEILKEYNAALVLHDLAASAPASNGEWGDSIYLRFHGPNGGYRGSYSNEQLMLQAAKAKDWLSAGKTVYCYFNNTAGDAFNNLQMMNRLVELGQQG